MTPDKSPLDKWSLSLSGRIVWETVLRSYPAQTSKLSVSVVFSRICTDCDKVLSNKLIEFICKNSGTRNDVL